MSSADFLERCPVSVLVDSVERRRTLLASLFSTALALLLDFNINQ